jgi:uncharacterized protein with HEPN domain
MQRDVSLLVDMADAARSILQFRGQMNFEQFKADRKT